MDGWRRGSGVAGGWDEGEERYPRPSPAASAVVAASPICRTKCYCACSSGCCIACCNLRLPLLYCAFLEFSPFAANQHLVLSLFHLPLRWSSLSPALEATAKLRPFGRQRRPRRRSSRRPAPPPPCWILVGRAASLAASSYAAPGRGQGRPDPALPSHTTASTAAAGLVAGVAQPGGGPRGGVVQPTHDLEDGGSGHGGASTPAADDNGTPVL